MVTSFHQRLEQACRTKDSFLCVGIDPRLAWLPRELHPGETSSLADRAQAYFEFGRAVLDLCEPYAAVVKPQSAFFEALGHDGVRVFEQLCAEAQARDLLVIGDLKRGDIGSTAEAYAEAAFRLRSGRPLMDAVTVSPYLGSDGIRPFFARAARCGGGVYVLCKTSNPSSSELQDLRLAEAGPVHEEMAKLITCWGSEHRGVAGAVVGGTHPRELPRLRALMPEVSILIPGVGAQGGSMADAALGFDDQGGGAVVNSSRGVTFPWSKTADAPANWRELIATAASKTRDELRKALAER